MRLSAGLFALAATAAHAQTEGRRLSGEACIAGDRRLNYGFFADFRPVSFSENPDPGSPGFDSHRGYEADLLSALETMADAGLAFDRSGIGIWPGIWLLPAGADHDFVGGGITILESRTRDANGVEQVAFTSGHIAFRQSLLVRAEDAERYASHGDLADARVAALGSSTGEHRLLVLTGVVNSEGNLAAGTTIHLVDGSSLAADGSADYRITAAGASGNLASRVRIEGPAGTVKEVLIMSTDQEQLNALSSGRVDALARGELGNLEASRNSDARADSHPFDGGRWRERRSELQFGAYRPLDGWGGDFRAGISAHVVRVGADVQNGRNPAESNAEAIAYGGAVSLTWFGQRRPYAATEARFSLWEADVDYRRRDLSTDVDGRSWGVSAETGWRFGTDGFRMIPRLRLAWTGVDFDRFTDSDGVAVRQEHDAAMEAALGLEIGIVMPDSGIRLYGDVEFAHDLEDDSAITAYGYRFHSGLADSWARLRVGAVREFSPRVRGTINGEFGVGQDSDTDNTSMWGIQAGVQWAL